MLFRSELDFPSALRERVALLKGLPIEALGRVYAERVRLNPGARVLVHTMRAHGAHTLLVSGGFTYFTSRVADDAGFDEHQGNRLLDDGRTLTGLVGEPILGREAKLRALTEARTQMKLAPEETVAIGDGANDLDMIKKAGLGIAYHAKPVVAAAAGAILDLVTSKISSGASAAFQPSTLGSDYPLLPALATRPTASYLNVAQLGGTRA